MSLRDASVEIQSKLTTRLRSLPLSTRAQNAVSQSGLVYAGELAQLSSFELKEFKNSGVTTTRELENVLAALGLKTGVSIPDWSRDLAGELEVQFANRQKEETRRRSSEVLSSIAPGPAFLEDELSRIASALEKGRNAVLLTKLWGWGGEPPCTLESVGNELHLTRERVRQIEARSLKRLRTFEFATRYLESAIAELCKQLPLSSEEAERSVRLAGISKADFSPRSLKLAAELLRRKWPIGEVVQDQQRILVAERNRSAFAKSVVAARRKTSELGCMHLHSLLSEIDVEERDAGALRKFLELVPIVEWLDETKEWLYIRDSARNRLYNLCAKVLGVCPKLRLVELRKSVARSRRLAVAPPQRILGAFVERIGLGNVVDGVVVANPSAVCPPSADSAEGILLGVLDKFGPAMDGEEFAEKCVAAGMNATTFYIYRLVSPVVAALGRGVFCKVGADVPPGLVDEIVSRRKSTPRILRYVHELVRRRVRGSPAMARPGGTPTRRQVNIFRFALRFHTES